MDAAESKAPASASANGAALRPFALRDAPALIEAVFPAQKVSFEAQRERKANLGQTLTALGSYWKGGKPLILVRAIVLGSLLPQTDDPEKDLEIFEKLMALDDASLAPRPRGVPRSSAHSARRRRRWTARSRTSASSTTSQGNRAKAYLSCLETRCPETGWMVMMAPSWVISKNRKVVAKLVPDHEHRRFDIEIHSGASKAEMAAAEQGTVRDGSLLVPDVLAAETWAAIAGIQPFYLRMLDMEATGAAKLDNDQNFAKAFRVQDYAAVMASVKPNAARLKGVTEFQARDLTDRTEIGPTRLGARIVTIQEFLADKDPEVVMANLRDAVPDYLGQRPRRIDMAGFLAAKARQPEIRRAAEAIAGRMRNQRLQ
jgi:hypothetical protein